MTESFDVTQLRRSILRMAKVASSGHIACAFSIVEILAVLYRRYLRYPGNEPRAQGRDYLILSKGHGVMAQYACMLEKGWLTADELDRYYSDGTRLVALSDSRIPGLEVTSGSLGHGFPVGVGIALGLKRSGASQKVYVVAGDGEMNEGAMWEAAMFAAHHQLDNLVLIIDSNKFQALGRTDEVMSMNGLAARLTAFGFTVAEVDGHDQRAICDGLDRLGAVPSGKPMALVAHTVKGKGVSFMEGENTWHYAKLDERSYVAALAELNDAKHPV